MALANVAYLLATDLTYGKNRVLMIDWDLEAPGLHGFFHKDFKEYFSVPETEEYADAMQNAPGLIDFLTDIAAYYRHRYPAGKLSERTAMTEQATEMFHEVLERFPLENDLLPVDGIPSLFLLKAGNEGQASTDRLGYAAKVGAFDWANFYAHYGSFFTHLREYLMDQYTYVLIDSRTGITGTSSICTRVMPEKLVAVFVPNRQNIDGLQAVIRRAVAYRRDSRDPRGLVAFPLASRIDASASRLRHIWWRGGEFDGDKIVGYQTTFETLFKEIYDLDDCSLSEYFDATQVPHDSDYAYGEQIAARVGADGRLSIGHACANLTRRLVSLSAPWEQLGSELKIA